MAAFFIFFYLNALILRFRIEESQASNGGLGFREGDKNEKRDFSLIWKIGWVNDMFEWQFRFSEKAIQTKSDTSSWDDGCGNE